MSLRRKLALVTVRLSLALSVTAAIVAAFTITFVSTKVLAAAANKFDIISTTDGKKIGSASYSIDKNKSGYHLTSTYNVQLEAGNINDLNPNTGQGEARGGGGSFFDVQYNNDFKVDPNGSFLSGYARSAATQTLITLIPSKNRSSIDVTINRGGPTNAGTQTVLLSKPDFFVIPNYDPSGFQVLITAAIEHPNADNNYLVVIPANLDAGNNSSNAGFMNLKADPEVTGSLDGKSMSVKHYSLSFHVNKAEIYTDESGTLMEVVMAPLKANYVRSKFALTN